MTDTGDPLHYSAEDIHALRPPELEERPGGHWKSRWVLRLSTRPTNSQLREVAQRLLTLRPEATVALTPLAGERLRLELVLPASPLDVESYLAVDDVLLAIDHGTAGIVEINDSPKAWWRTFRNRSAATGSDD